MSELRSPAEVVLSEFRNVGITGRGLARLLECAPTTVMRWTWPEPDGSGGLIPPWWHRPLLELAAAHGASLTANDIVLGRT